MNNSTDCSITAYARQFNIEFNQCLSKQPLNDVSCIVSSVLNTINEMTTRCSAQQANLDCTPQGYVVAVIKSINLEKQMTEFVINKVSKELIPSYQPSAGGVGCLVGGALGYGIGIYVTRNPVAARLAAAIGCKRGAVIAETADRGYNIVVKLG